MSVIWTRPARRDITHIRTYIAKENPSAAKKVATAIVLFAEQQLVFTQSGRAGRVTGTRELVVPKLPYTIAYRIVDDRVEILRVIHQSRLWPDTV